MSPHLLIQRTHLNLTIMCQAIHTKNSRHMLIDLIDFLEPTLVIVGSRGLGKLKGCVQSTLPSIDFVKLTDSLCSQNDPRFYVSLPRPEVVGARHGRSSST